MSEADEPRPRAQYGEYATPEEQQAARGLPESTPDTSRADAANAPVPAFTHQAPPQPASRASEPAPSGPAHPVDRVVTLILLAVGLFFWLSGIPGYLALADTLQTVFDQLGAGTYQAAETAAALGVAALVVQGIVWAGTAASAWYAMKRGRLAWWIAVVGAALYFIASMVVVSIALFADPGFIDSVSTQTLP